MFSFLKCFCLLIAYGALIGNITALVLVGRTLHAGHMKKKIQDVYVAFLLGHMLSFPFKIVLIYGLHRRIRNNVEAYLIITTLWLVFFAIVTMIGIFRGIKSEDSIFNVVFIGKTILSLLILRCHYNKMEEDKNDV